MHSGIFALDTRDLRDIASDCLDETGRLRVMPASYYASIKPEERAWFALRHGFYCLPTVELADWLRRFISARSAIEIGAGNGVLAQYLGIPATDSYMQDDPSIRLYYKVHGQPTIPYGPNVERIEALDAAKKYEPGIILGSWITHRWDPQDPSRGGNMYGPDLPAILRHCSQYVLIGNELTHGANPLWARKHEVVYPPWLYSRSLNHGREFIAIWNGDKP